MSGKAFTPGAVTVHHDPHELGRVTAALRQTGRTVTLVPTMGALHVGHRELIRRARRVPNSVTVVSVFVNPLQFGAGEDLERYPRDLQADLDMCSEEGVELVFAPNVEAMYGTNPQVTVHPGELGDELEGASRPGHFAGVLTVVAKLFGIVGPHIAFFGEKDYQQLVLVRKMSAELNLGVKVAGIPIIRDADGLALSSRNAYLSAEQRSAAVVLSAALAAGTYAGVRGAQAVCAAADEVLRAEPQLHVDYLELRDPELAAAPEQGEARLLVAGWMGSTRLLDNALVVLGDASASDSTANE